MKGSLSVCRVLDSKHIRNVLDVYMRGDTSIDDGESLLRNQFFNFTRGGVPFLGLHMTVTYFTPKIKKSQKCE